MWFGMLFHTTKEEEIKISTQLLQTFWGQSEYM